MFNSIYENVTKDIAPAIRKINDIQIGLLGIPVQMLRVTEVERNMMGDKDFVYTSEIIDNVFVNFPFGEIDLLASFDTANQTAESIYMEDLLPVIIKVPFEGTQATKPVDLDRNDILCIVIFDGKGNKIPIMMKAPKIISSFMGRHEIERKYQAVLMRETLEDALRVKVDEYIATITNPDITGVVVNEHILEFYWDTSMDTDSIIANTQIAPSGTLSLSTNYNLYRDRTYITADWELNTNYTLIFPKTIIKSSIGAEMINDYSYNFSFTE